MKKYNSVRQHDQTDCGAACLATIFNYYGLYVAVTKLRELVGTDRNGTNMLGLIETANEYGFDTKTVKVEQDKFKESLPMPFIAHIVTKDNLQHFVVVHKITNNKVIIADPAKGIERLDLQDFFDMWTKIILLLVPNDKFKKSDYSINVLKRFLPLAMEQKKKFIFVILSSLMITGIGIVTSYYGKYLFDSIIPNNKEDILFYLSLSIIIMYIIQSFLNWYRTYSLTLIRQYIDRELFTNYYNHVLKLPMRFFGTRKTGDIIARFQDMDNITELISGATLTIILDTIMAIIGGVIVFLQDRVLFLVCVAIVLIYFLLVLVFKKGIRNKNETVMEDNSIISSRLIETLTGVLTIKSFNAEEKIYNETESKYKRLLRSVFKLDMTINLLSTLDTILQLVGGISVYWIGAYRVFAGHMTIGGLITFNMLLAYFLSPVKNLIDLQPQIQSANIAAKRATEILDLEEEIDYEHRYILENFYDKIDINNIDFRYGKRRLVLNNINITINRGERVAFIGESGCGKTTLSMLLMAFYTPEKGEILIDGHNLSTISKKSLRSNIAYVPQETFLLSGSILDNLCIGLDEVDMHEVEKVAKITKINEFINEMPLKYNTYLEENGSNLSGGQRQRIAIARALLRKPKILILDEATSNLDSITEKAIQKTINQESNNMTVIIIAHRLSTIRNCDRIYVFKDGTIAESGTHEELIRHRSLYYDFCENI